METKTTIRRPLMSVREAAELAGVTESTAYRWANTGELPGAVRVHGRWYVRRVVLEAWLAGGAIAERFAA